MKTQSDEFRHTNLRAIIFVLSILSLLSTGCGGGGDIEEGGVPVDVELPSAVKLIYEFNFDDESIANIGSEGGETSLDTESGVVITLSIPPNAVLEEQAFSLIPVISIAGAPTGFNPIAAVRLGPSDQPFASPAIVTFDIPVEIRENNPIVGFFTNNDGTDFYLTPLIGPDGAFADYEESDVSITKSSFTVGGAASLDSSYSNEQGPEIIDRGKSAQNGMAMIRNDLIERQRLDDFAAYTTEELHLLNVLITNWNTDLRRRLELLVLAFEVEGSIDPIIKELFKIYGDRILMESTAQRFFMDISDIAGYLSSEELVTELESAIDHIYDASFDDCLTMDIDKIQNSEKVRSTLISFRQMMNADYLPSSPENIPCRFDVEILPELTHLKDESDAAVVTAVFKPYDPRTGTTLPAFDGATFLLLGDFDADESSNVTLVVYSSNELRFLLEGYDVGTVTISGFRVLSPKTVKAQIQPLSGRWFEATTPIESTCELEDTVTFYLNITQSDDILEIAYPALGTVNAKIENWGGEGPWGVTTEQQSASDTPECNAFFDDIDAWLGGLPPLNSCVPTFCNETQKMTGTVMEDLKTIRGIVEWVFEYRAICTYSGEETFNYTLSEKCEGAGGFVATKQ